MKNRYLIYITLSILFAIWYWYIPLWIRSLPAIPSNWWWLPYALWLLPGLFIALSEAQVTSSAKQSALSLTTFWACSIAAYYIYYWLMVVLPVTGGNWLAQSFSFFNGAILHKILLWELISLISGLPIGYAIGKMHLLLMMARLKAGARMCE